MCKNYNGYTNYQTWNVATWIMNDEGLLASVQEWDNVADLAVWLRKYHADETNPLVDQANTYADLLGHALANVDWYEVAEAVTAE